MTSEYDWPDSDEWDGLSLQEQRYRALELFLQATINRHKDYYGKWTPAQNQALRLYDLANEEDQL